MPWTVYQPTLLKLKARAPPPAALPHPCHSILCPKSLGLPNCHSLVRFHGPHCHSHLPTKMWQGRWRTGFGTPSCREATILKVVRPPSGFAPFSVSVRRAVTGSFRLSGGELSGGLAVPKVLCRRLLCSAGVSCSCVDGTLWLPLRNDHLQIFFLVSKIYNRMLAYMSLYHIDTTNINFLCQSPGSAACPTELKPAPMFELATRSPPLLCFLCLKRRRHTMTSPRNASQSLQHAGPAPDSAEAEIEEFLRQLRSNISGPTQSGSGYLYFQTATHVSSIWIQAGPLFREWARRATPGEREEVLKRAQIDFWSEDGDTPQKATLRDHLVRSCPACYLSMLTRLTLHFRPVATSCFTFLPLPGPNLFLPKGTAFEGDTRLAHHYSCPTN